MVLCEHRAWFRAEQAWPRRARADRAAARTRGYCWSKVTEWSGARGGFILARRVPCGSAQVPTGPVTLRERDRATVSGSLGSSASSAGFWGACTASSHRRAPRPPRPVSPARPGLGCGTAHRGPQMEGKRELTDDGRRNGFQNHGSLAATGVRAGDPGRKWKGRGRKEP